jgi:hypothetical protein
LTTPLTAKVAGVDAARVQLLFSVTVRISPEAEALATPQPAPEKPVRSVTVGEEGTPVNAVGQTAVIVLPEMALKGLESVKPSVHVDVAPVSSEAAANVTAVGAVEPVMTMADPLALRAKFVFVSIEKPALADCVVLAV